jgi:hypothetical protein
MALANAKKADPFIVVIDLLSHIHPPDLQHAIAEYCTELSVPFPHSSLVYVQKRIKPHPLPPKFDCLEYIAPLSGVENPEYKGLPGNSRSPGGADFLSDRWTQR